VVTLQELFIDGAATPARSGATFDDISPVTGEAFRVVSAGVGDDAEAAIAAAHRAFPNWATTSIVERRRILLKAADLLEEQLPAMTELFALETGGVAGWAAMNTMEAAATLREAAGLVTVPIGELLPSHDPNSINESRRTPAGVVLGIIPWNAPLILSARAVAIAIAVGNTVVLRPSEEAPLTAGFVLADVLTRAGLPHGVVNVISTAPGDGPPTITAMIEDPRVRRVVFIGSTAVGRRIAEVAGRALTPAVLELGGKNPTIVLDDTDLELWAPRLAFAAFANSGQVCMCTDRIVVARSRAQELTDRLAAIAEAGVVGDPRSADTEYGPLINARAAGAFRDLVGDAVSHGATLVAGSAETEGLYARPTVLTGLTPKARLWAEESFSPVVSVHAVDSEDEAVALANDTEYGLIASVLSGDESHARRVAGRVRSGAVHVNGPSVGDEPHVAFGGLGASGAGRLGGMESVRSFTEQRTFYLHGQGGPLAV
jgi:benzaldehyde dehydrogenase (NAD)